MCGGRCRRQWAVLSAGGQVVFVRLGARAVAAVCGGDASRPARLPALAMTRHARQCSSRSDGVGRSAGGAERMRAQQNGRKFSAYCWWLPWSAVRACRHPGAAGRRLRSRGIPCIRRSTRTARDAQRVRRGTAAVQSARCVRSRTAGETLAVGRGCMPRAHADQTWDDSDVQMSMPEREGSHAFWRVHITHVHSHAHRGREFLAHTRSHAAAGRGQKQTSWSSWRSSSSPTHGSTSRP